MSPGASLVLAIFVLIVSILALLSTMVHVGAL